MAPNLERHPTIAGRWIAYDAQGLAFRVMRAHPGYIAQPSHAGAATDARRFRADTLKACAALIGASAPLPHPTDRPMAAQGLISYRYAGPYGPIMIGARDDADALNEARRSLDSGTAPDAGLLQRWNGEAYVPVKES